MNISNLKELKALIKLCQDTGVDSIKIDNIELTLGSAPIKYAQPRQSSSKLDTTGISPGGITDRTRIITDELTPEQLLFYSSDGRDAASDFGDLS